MPCSELIAFSKVLTKEVYEDEEERAPFTLFSKLKTLLQRDTAFSQKVKTLQKNPSLMKSVEKVKSNPEVIKRVEYLKANPKLIKTLEKTPITDKGAKRLRSVFPIEYVPSHGLTIANCGYGWQQL
ncbi:unnamed protein product [Phytophthora lilii]|uniref:Unnamed protein product n=1 Tax=Phytophthora lilii TaxID=2077276 RepID=A0A9W6U0W5_9STRA|nr:unnamed protein product [Phytophthora lilii]